MNTRHFFIPCLIALLLAPVSRADESVIQCANLIYAGTKTSRCFSDQFLTAMQQKTAIPVERRFRSVKLGSDELFDYPFVMMTGESSFFLTSGERENLKRYLENGGFLLASAGCSNQDWGRSFRAEMKKIFGDDELAEIDLAHPIFRTVYQIEKLELYKSSGEATLEGIELDGKLVVVYSDDGLNDTSNRAGCCCCGGNEIANAMEVNVNVLSYALLY
ncbi:MAG: DUF4159 domain-containing protein [Verrucomicrobiota bacterium]